MVSILSHGSFLKVFWVVVVSVDDVVGVIGGIFILFFAVVVGE